jgi:hypothetical protein
MKLLIQLTFSNGLGNLYCGVIEILNFVNYYKNIGYTCELIFASNGDGMGNKFINYCNFEEVFDLDSFKIFERIRNVEHSIKTKIFEDYTYHSTQYGPDRPGVHWWDVFFNELPEKTFPKYDFNMETLLSNKHIPIFLPKFNKKVYERVDNFELGTIKKSIQIRFFDYTLTPTEDFSQFVEELHNKLVISNSKFYFTSNNKFILDRVKLLPNIITYKYENLEKLPNDHGYYFYNKNFNRELLLDRLYDNLAEMVILSKFKEIYYYTSFSWNSTFLYYSKSHNPDQQIINIKKNLELIT